MRRQLCVPIGVKMASSPQQTDRSQTRPAGVWQRRSRSREGGLPMRSCPRGWCKSGVVFALFGGFGRSSQAPHHVVNRMLRPCVGSVR
jgi:hypothetical protein